MRTWMAPSLRHSRFCARTSVRRTFTTTTETKIHISRAAGKKHLLASATRGGSCTHPDQSRGLAHRHNVRAISGAGASSPILLFFIGGGVALHERLVGLLIGKEHPLFAPGKALGQQGKGVATEWMKGMGDGKAMLSIRVIRCS